MSSALCEMSSAWAPLLVRVSSRTENSQGWLAQGDEVVGLAATAGGSPRSLAATTSASPTPGSPRFPTSRHRGRATGRLRAAPAASSPTP